MRPVIFGAAADLNEPLAPGGGELRRHARGRGHPVEIGDIVPIGRVACFPGGMDDVGRSLFPNQGGRFLDFRKVGCDKRYGGRQCGWATTSSRDQLNADLRCGEPNDMASNQAADTCNEQPQASGPSKA